jgi:penicillin V acylase-like amidase (Ntn superfamily)
MIDPPGSPTDGGYPSLAIQAFDLLSGTIDGINDQGLVVSVIADHEAYERLGADLELQAGPPRVVRLHELQMARHVLDTCATADDAQAALLEAKDFYLVGPAHYLVADRSGRSFIFEPSTGRNAAHILEGEGEPQVLTSLETCRRQGPARTQWHVVHDQQLRSLTVSLLLDDRSDGHPRPPV